MKANPSKFQIMFLKHKRKKDPFTKNCKLNIANIERSHAVKLLGICIDDKLMFEAHMSEMCKKAARQLNSLKRLNIYLSDTVKITLYNSFILANFNFCPKVWHFCGKAGTLKMESTKER